MISIEKPILQVLEVMQQIAPTYLTGGYLRDKLVGILPNDVDILTSMSMEDVQKLFPQLQGTETGLAFGVGRFARNGFQFEITSRTDVPLEALFAKKDFVLNSLYHDGKTLFDPYGGIQDIEQKMIRSLDDPFLHCKEMPQTYLRALRFPAQLGFSLDPTLWQFLKSYPAFFSDNNESRIQQEGYRIVRAAYPLYTFELLATLGVLQDVGKGATKAWDKEALLPTFEDKPHLRLLLLSEYTGLDAIHQFIDTFHLTKHLKEQIHYYLPYLTSEEIPHKPHVLNTVILLKRVQYEQQPEKFQAFLAKIKASRKQ